MAGEVVQLAEVRGRVERLEVWRASTDATIGMLQEEIGHIGAAQDDMLKAFGELSTEVRVHAAAAARTTQDVGKIADRLDRLAERWDRFLDRWEERTGSHPAPKPVESPPGHPPPGGIVVHAEAVPRIVAGLLGLGGLAAGGGEFVRWLLAHG